MFIYNLFLHLDFFFFFNDTATTEIYTLSLHDALPIWRRVAEEANRPLTYRESAEQLADYAGRMGYRSEEHTSELQSRLHLVCRLLLEKKKHKIDHKSQYNMVYKRVIGMSIETLSCKEK